MSWAVTRLELFPIVPLAAYGNSFIYYLSSLFGKRRKMCSTVGSLVPSHVEMKEFFLRAHMDTERAQSPTSLRSVMCQVLERDK